MSEIIGEHKIISSVHDENFWRLMKAESSATGEQYWFRILYQKYANDEQLLERFFQIAHSSTSLNFPQIPKIIDYGSQDNLNFISMQHFTGEPLVNLLSPEKVFNEKRAIKIVVQIAQTLQYAKLSGTVHGCLTGNSIFVNNDDQIAIIDFGSGAFWDYLLHDKREDGALDRACFLSPQILKQDAVANTGGDLYSLGILLFFMLTGHVPFNADKLNKIINLKETARPSLLDLNPKISPSVENVVYRLIDPNPEHRFPSISHFLREIAPETVNKDALPDRDFVNKPVTVREKLQKRIDHLPPVVQNLIPTWVGSKRRLAFSVLAVFILVLIIFIVAISSGFKSDKTTEVDEVYQEYLSQTTDLESRKAEKVVAPEAENPVKIEQPIEEEMDIPVQSPDVPTQSDQIPIEEPSQAFVAESEQEKTDDFEQVKIISSNTDKLNEAFLISVNVKGIPITATVFLDGNEQGTTNKAGNFGIPGLEAGKRYRFRVEKAGFQAWEEQIAIDSETMGGLEIELLPENDVVRRFMIENVEFADRVIVDNKLPSHTLPYDIDLAPGVHSLKYVESNSMFSFDSTMFLDMDTPAKLTVDAKSLGSGSLSVVVQNAVQVGYAYVSVDGEEKLRTTPLRLQLPVGQHKVIIFREGYEPIPRDTTVIVLPDRKTALRCRLIPNS